MKSSQPLLVALLWLILVLGCSLPTERVSNNADVSQPTAAPTLDRNLLEVVKSDWQRGGFDTVAIWKVTFRNKSDRPIGNIKYRTRYYAETGAVVDKGGVDSLISKDTLQKVIKPGQTRTIEVNDGFINDESDTATFEVVSWEHVP